MKNASFGDTFAISIMIALTVYYIIANVFCFLAYREFKGMLMDYQGGGGYAMGGMRMPGGGGAQNAQRVAQDRAEERQAFMGQGQQIGGGGAAPRGPPNNSAAASSGGGFKAFSGQGVKIGGS